MTRVGAEAKTEAEAGTGAETGAEAGIGGEMAGWMGRVGLAGPDGGGRPAHQSATPYID